MNINKNILLDLYAKNDGFITKLPYSNTIIYNNGTNYSILINLTLDKSSNNEIFIVNFLNFNEIISTEGFS